MSNQYNQPHEVPTAALCKRLDELATAVTKGRAAVEREFVMRVPAELDHCPDLVLSLSAGRLLTLERENTQMLSVLKQIAIADHPAITNKDDAAELGRRLTTAAKLARVYLSET